MKRALLALVGVVALVVAQPAALRAEIYMGIRPFDTLGDIKKLFPGATLEDLKPAWAKPADRLVNISGSGISGDITVLFFDPRPGDLDFLKNYPNSVIHESVTKDSQKTDDDALEVTWVRWSPDVPGIPVARLISKYGPAFEKGYSDSNFAPYRLWKSAGVEAFLDDSEKTVTRVDFTFTIEEYCSAAKSKQLAPLIVARYCKAVR